MKVSLRTRTLPVVLALLLLPSLSVRGADEPEIIRIDTTAPSRPFPHFWEQMFGSGRAVLSLRDSYRRDLQAVKRVTGFTYIRFHAIFHDEMGVYDEDDKGNPQYNFSYVDQVYDGLLANGVKPFVELSFMPRKLASDLTPHAFWYKPYPSPPKDSVKWQALITAFTNHLLERYGRPEVESWYFEVWNEPNIDFWTGTPKEQTYYALYDVTAQAIKQVDPKLRVGGPSTAQSAWVDKFIAHCLQGHIPFDFVSTHVYGDDSSMDVFGKPGDISRRDMVARAVRKVYDQVKASQAPNTPIIWSEYNATYMTRTEITDSAFMGPWLANNIRECDGLTTIMSYWAFSDVFEEQGVVKTPYYGGYGLVAERGIPKAAYRAFELLHRLGDQRLPSASENTLITRRADGTLVIALWNYADIGTEEGPSKSFRLEMNGKASKSYRLQTVDARHGSSKDKWLSLGSPKLPTLQQSEELRRSSELAPPVKHSMNEVIQLPPHGLALIEIAPR